MLAQPANLFTLPPAARVSDPSTSHDSAHRLRTSGQQAHQIRQVVAAVESRPGRTSRELADETGYDRYMIARRLPDAEKNGLVRKGEKRICRIGGTPAVTWVAVERGGSSSMESDR